MDHHRAIGLGFKGFLFFIIFSEGFGNLRQIQASPHPQRYSNIPSVEYHYSSPPYNYQYQYSGYPLDPNPPSSSHALRFSPFSLSKRKMMKAKEDGNMNMEHHAQGPNQNPNRPFQLPVSGPQHPSSQLHGFPNSHSSADANSLMLDFLYDYSEVGRPSQIASIPQDFGWVHPPSPPPTVVTATMQTGMEVETQPQYPMSPVLPMPQELLTGTADKDKDTTEESESATDEDEDSKMPQQQPPTGTYGWWSPFPIAETTGGIVAMSKAKLNRLKKKWNHILEALKIRDVHDVGGMTNNREPPRDAEIINRRPIKAAGSGNLDLERLPGWNLPPLKNPKKQGQNQNQHYPYPYPETATTNGFNGYKKKGYYVYHNGVYEWVELPYSHEVG